MERLQYLFFSFLLIIVSCVFFFLIELFFPPLITNKPLKREIIILAGKIGKLLKLTLDIHESF